MGCNRNPSAVQSESVIAEGHAPSLAKDKEGNLYLAYCKGDSIMYTYSANKGSSFSSPVLVARLPELASSHARGPQIAVSGQGISIIAVNHSGNIFSFEKNGSGGWRKVARVNDRDSAAREGLTALGGDGNGLFAVWLDIRDGHNRIYGAASADGGESWSKNSLIYASPDSSVCECCKPSVAVKGSQVYVMFRNLIGGNRDLYLIRSADGGKTFDQAEKLGNGSWALNGCPMDGGGLVINENGSPETVWRRQDKIYACEPGKPEKEIAEGRNCSIGSVNGKEVYAWTQKGQVICRLSPENIQNLGKGSLPVLQTINKEQVVCVWENESKLHAAVLAL